MQRLAMNLRVIQMKKYQDKVKFVNLKDTKFTNQLQYGPINYFDIN